MKAFWKQYAYVIIIVGCITILSLGITAYLVSPKEAAVNQSQQQGLVIEKDTVDWNQTIPTKEEVDEEAIKIPYYDTFGIALESQYVGIKLVNPKENRCYFTYTWNVEGIEDPVYSSNLIEPGKAINGIKMNQTLEKGTYTLSMNIDTYCLETMTALNKAVIKTTMVVQ